LAERNEWNRMVAMKDGRITSVPLESVAGGTRSVDPACDLVAAARGMGIAFGDEASAPTE
jgi:6-phosphofructokinase 1